MSDEIVARLREGNISEWYSREREAADLIEQQAARIAELEKDAARWKQWSKDFTFYNTEEAGPHYVPTLASVSKRIWYHACDDTEHNTVTEYVDAAIDAAMGKP